MAVTDHPLAGLGYTRVSATRSFVRLTGDSSSESSAEVAEEVPIALVYNGRPYVVVMGTPNDLDDLAVGFSITEGIVDDAARVERVEAVRANHGIELQIQISPADAERLSERVRGLVSRTGCGLCGVETIGDALRIPSEVGRKLRVERGALWRAGWSTADGELSVAREDVGRHNALDKVLGALARAGTPASNGFVVVTSRASYEMIQKAAVCGVELVAAISRPTGLAIRFAEAAGVTLVGLLRGESANVYTHPERIHPLSLEV